MAGTYDDFGYDEETYDESASGGPIAGVVVEIGGVDRTDIIDWRSFRFDQALTSQIDTVRFRIRKHAGQAFKPDVTEEISVFEDGVKVFGGQVVEVSESIAGQLEFIDVFSKDHSHEMDNAIVVDSFEDTTIDAIIASIAANFLPPGFSTAGVSVTTPIKSARFNYEQPSKVFQQLAEETGSDWLVDENRVVQFFPRGANAAPFNLSDSDANTNYVWNSLKIRKSIKNLRNVIFVRGGNFFAALDDEVVEADGDALIFKQGRRYKSVKVFVDTGSGFVEKTLGIDNISAEAAFDAFYNFVEKYVRFKTSTQPASTDLVKVEGLPETPIIIKIRDNASITELGFEREFKIIDKSIKSKEEARQRGKGDLERWAQTLDEGEFVTRETGLRVGQLINVDSAIRGISEDFVITRIATRMDTPTDLIHRVTLVSKSVFGFVEFLQLLLIQKDKEIKIDEDEVLDKIEEFPELLDFAEAVAFNANVQTFAESMDFAEAVVTAIDNGTEFVYAPFPTPTGVKREARFDGAVYK